MALLETMAEPGRLAREFGWNGHLRARRWILLALQGYTCPACGGELREIVPDFAPTCCCNVDVDHIIPHCRGGPTVLRNLQAVHRTCNMAKGTKLTPQAEALAAEHGITLREPRRRTRKVA